MFRTDRWRSIAAAAPLVLALTLGGGVSAQTSFEDGSFAGGGAAQEPQGGGGAWPAAPADGFGGSFEGGQADAPPEGEAATDDFGGSFEGSFESEAVQETADTPPAEAELAEAAEAPEAEAEAEVQAAETAQEDEAPVTAAEEDDPILAFELRDYDVPPTQWLRQGAFHAPTPVAVPGATVITTAGLAEAIASNEVAFVLIDVLGGEYMLPNALSATGLASPGSYGDRTQQQAVIWLAQVTGGNPDVPVVLYCSDPMCWMSYNAALRAVAAGYTNVYWYRGGLQAWQMAGLPVFPSGF